METKTELLDPPATNNTTSSARFQWRSLEKHLCSSFVERDDVIHGMLAAALAGEHVVLLGPPGTAKSELAREFAHALEVPYFETLLMKFSAPEQVFGPISFAALKDDRYARKTAGYLPEAGVAFLDEIFKANAAILNALLGVLNERVFHDDGQAKKIPLRLVVSASNELPQPGQGLEALWDRFLLRFVVDDIHDPNKEAQLLVERAKRRTVTNRFRITQEAWDAARAEVEQVTFSPVVAEQLVMLKRRLGKDEAMRVSTRRMVRATGVLKAHAWLTGSSEVEDEHFDILRDIFWDQLDQRSTISTAVDSTVSPLLVEAQQKHDAVIKLADAALQSDSTSKVQAAGELKKANDLLRGLLAKAKSGSRTEAKIKKLGRSLGAKAKAVQESYQAALGLDVDTMKNPF